MEQNSQLLLRDRDWMNIFSNMEFRPESYERYYPMVRVGMNNRELRYLVTALVVNDALYESAQEWERE